MEREQCRRWLERDNGTVHAASLFPYDEDINSQCSLRIPPVITETMSNAALVADGPAVPEGREPAAVVGEPSDAELLELMPQQFRDDLATVSWLASYGTPVEPGIYRVILSTGALDFARAVLARWGQQPAPPVEGEVAELVRWLRSLEDASVWFESGSPEALKLTRAADLLAQRHPAPVPVNERPPGDQLCWWYEPDEYDDGSGYGGKWTLLRIRGGTATYTHWLPATALPLPAFWGGDCDKTSTSVNR